MSCVKIKQSSEQARTSHMSRGLLLPYSHSATFSPKIGELYWLDRFPIFWTFGRGKATYM